MDEHEPSAAQHEPLGCAQGFGKQGVPIVQAPEQDMLAAWVQSPAAEQHAPIGGGCGQGLGEQTKFGTHGVLHATKVVTVHNPFMAQHAPVAGGALLPGCASIQLVAEASVWACCCVVIPSTDMSWPTEGTTVSWFGAPATCKAAASRVLFPSGTRASIAPWYSTVGGELAFTYEIAEASPQTCGQSGREKGTPM